MKSSIVSSVIVTALFSYAASAQNVTAAAPSPTATLGSTNIQSLEALGYNPAQASFYASAISRTGVASAYEALNAEGAIDELNAATASAEYYSILNAAVASLPESLRAPATFFFGGLNALETPTTTLSTVDSPIGAATATGATVTGPSVPGSIILDTTMSSPLPAPQTASAGASMTGTGGVVITSILSLAQPSTAGGVAAVARPTGALAAGLAGLAGIAMAL